ncbi:hypothetical protein DCC62_27840 [candidate division KSB1 bacterium]|nr:MAG: hypothetical protein DCC62_27840 [candidate division KSB1 bacterium]
MKKDNVMTRILLIACGQPAQQNTNFPEAMFRGDARHTGIYETKAVARFDDVKWAFQTQGPVRSSAAISGDIVYFGSGDNHLYAVDLHSGREKWSIRPANSCLTIGASIIMSHHRSSRKASSISAAATDISTPWTSRAEM